MTGRRRDLDISWARRRGACALREAILVGVLAPLMDLYTLRRVSGTEHLDAVAPPVIFVATHASHMDTPAILRALPPRWRRRTAVAAAADYFYRRRRVAHAVSLLFSTVPLDRSGGRESRATTHLAELMDDRWSVLLYAEGTRSRDGRVGPLHSGAAMLAAEHGVALVPVFVGGTGATMPPGRRWMSRTGGGLVGRRRRIEIRFGPAIRAQEGEHRREVMERVREFFAECGAVTTPDERLAAVAATRG
jgi:1-acyl-sn-glycerol-3-phosphate acyltransferase